MADEAVTDVSPGWYPDPRNASRLRHWDGAAWTARTRGTVARTESTGLWLAVGGAVLLLVGLGIGALLYLGGDRGAPATTPLDPTASPDAPQPDAPPALPAGYSVPDGWEVYTAPSGTLTYAKDPAWGDASALVSNAGDLLAEDAPGVAVEIAGLWQVDGSLLAGGTNALVIAASDGNPVRGIELQLAGYVSEATASLENVVDHGKESFTTAQGYPAAVERVSGEQLGTGLSLIAYAISAGDTIVFVQFASPLPVEDIEGVAAQLVDTIVVHRAPVGS